MQSSQKNWQVETQGQIYEADFEELKQWIAEGAVLSSDNVKRGNLRWLPAEKVPELSDFFSSKDLNCAPPDNFTANNFAEGNFAFEPLVLPENITEETVDEVGGAKVCYRHMNTEGVYICSVCKTALCILCPKSYGGSVKLCPLCGAMCVSAAEPLENVKVIGSISKPYYKTEESVNRPDEKKGFRFPVGTLSKDFLQTMLFVKRFFQK